MFYNYTKQNKQYWLLWANNMNLKKWHKIKGPVKYVNETCRKYAGNTVQ
jgi:hypothetical protein